MAALPSGGDGGGRRPPRRWLLLLLLAVALAVAVRPLLAPYQVAGHSAYSDLVRAEALHQAVAGGDLTPRWLPDFYFRHGSPTFNFYAPGAFYAVEALRRAGLSTLWALKAAYLLAWLLGTAAVYRLAAAAVDRDGALPAAAAYALAPYLLIDAYVRAGVAEFAAFGLLPAALLGAYRCGAGGGGGAVLLAAAATAGLVFTHNATALAALPLVAGLALVSAAGGRAKVRAVAAVGLGLGLAACFWLPALVEKGAVGATASLTGGYFDFRRHFVPPDALVTGGGAPGLAVGPGEEVPVKLGGLLALGLLGGAAALLWPVARRRFARPRAVAFALAGALGCLFLTGPASAALWRAVPLLPYLQFPWRLLLPASVLAALLVACLPRLAPAPARTPLALALVLAAVAGSWGYPGARYAFHDPAGDRMLLVPAAAAAAAAADPGLVDPSRFLSIDAIRRLGVTGTVGDEYLPTTVEVLPSGLPPAAAQAVDPGVAVLASGWTYPGVWAEVEAAAPGELVLSQFHFPGWRAEVDGRPVAARAEAGRGRIRVAVPAGRHRVEARFGATPTRRLGRAVSALALLALAAWLAAAARRRSAP